MNKKTQKIVFGAMIAAIYAVITIFTQPISFAATQVRVAEALTVLPYFCSFPIAGVFVGCLISNIYGSGILDIVFGSLATLIAALITRKIGKSKSKFKKYLAPLPPVVINAIVVGFIINTTLSKDVFKSFDNLLKGVTVNTSALTATIISVFIGEFIACYVIGLPLLTLIEKNKVLNKYFK